MGHVSKTHVRTSISFNLCGNIVGWRFTRGLNLSTFHSWGTTTECSSVSYTPGLVGTLLTIVAVAEWTKAEDCKSFIPRFESGRLLYNL